MFGYCQDGRYAYRSLRPVVETDTRLQYATILNGPILVTKELSASWIDGVDEEGDEYLVCLQTVDLTDNRYAHSHDWVPARRMVQYLFPDEAVTGGVA